MTFFTEIETKSHDSQGKTKDAQWPTQFSAKPTKSHKIYNEAHSLKQYNTVIKNNHVEQRGKGQPTQLTEL